MARKFPSKFYMNWSSKILCNLVDIFSYKTVIWFNCLALPVDYMVDILGYLRFSLFCFIYINDSPWIHVTDFTGTGAQACLL